MGVLDKEFLQENFVVSNLDAVLKWARVASVWQTTFGLACCAIEMMATSASHYDFDRFGLFPAQAQDNQTCWLSPALLHLKWLHELKEYTNKCPIRNMWFRWEVAQTAADRIGTRLPCAQRRWQVIPVDVYVPGCPPRPEALLEGLLKLKEKIANESLIKSAWNNEDIRRTVWNLKK